MRILLLLLLFITLNEGRVNAQSTLPAWFTQVFQSKGLSKKYEVKSFIKPQFLSADFNGDKLSDVAVSIIEKASKKRGILIIHQKDKQHFVFGAGTMVGKKDFDATDDLKWMQGWVVYREKIAEETTFDSEGNILGSKTRKLKNTGISIYELMDGTPLAGGIISWDGKKYTWIHQGE